MKRFDFPLEKVRQWRHEQADLEEQKLQKLYFELRAIDTKRTQIEEERDQATRMVREQNEPNAVDLANLDDFRELSRQRLAANARVRRDCEARIEKQRQALLEARRSFELLDRLKQKAWVEWKSAQAKEQEELAAELYLAKRQRENRFSEN